MILPQTDSAGAVATAERLRSETAGRMRELLPEGITVSVGVAVTSEGVPDARGLPSAADRGLYAAKLAGRDRSMTA
jgi:two-component system cell cycle response regulator